MRWCPGIGPPKGEVRLPELQGGRAGRWLLVSTAAAALAMGRPISAQEPGLSGYYLAVPTYVGESAINPAGSSLFQRGRLMWVGQTGPLLLDLAYEHTLSLQETGSPGAQLFTAAGTATGGDWLDLGGTIESGDQTTWRHRVDRLSLQLDLGESADLVVGRQPVSWATTLVFTPGDPFSPFDPADPFREYRKGVDAARLRYYRGAFTQFELVVRPAEIGDDETLTALGRAATNVRGWDVGAWGGALHDQLGAAVFGSGAIGLWAVRFEAVVRELDGDQYATRTSVGIDRYLGLSGRDLYVVLEYQRDGLGATGGDGLLDVARSRNFAQGEMQSLGRDLAAGQLSYQLHTLVSGDVLLLTNLRDGSVLLAPGLGYSMTHSMALRVGAFFGFGDGITFDAGDLSIGSEFGGTPNALFASFNYFF